MKFYPNKAELKAINFSEKEKLSDYEYSYLIQIICRQLYDFKHFKQIYSFE